MVNPRPRQVQTRGQLTLGLLEARATACLQALAGFTLEHDVLHAALTAQLALVLTVAVLVDHQAVRMDHVEGGQEVQETATLIDVGLLDIADGTYHKQPLLLAIHRLVTLQGLDGLVAADAHIQVTKLRRLPEELHVPRV